MQQEMFHQELDRVEQVLAEMDFRLGEFEQRIKPLYQVAGQLKDEATRLRRMTDTARRCHAMSRK